MDSETARFNMIEQQIRPWNVLEMKTLNALAEVRREDFVPQAFAHLAFVDTQIPLGDDEVMLEPKICGRMVEALDINPEHTILEIGTGSGYITALMALLGNHVTSVELDPGLSAQASRNLGIAGIENITLACMDCFDYCRNEGSDDEGRNDGSAERKFDRLLINGSLPDISPLFLNMLKENGVAAGFAGHEPAIQAVVMGENGSVKSLFETSVPRLKNVVESVAFQF